jgi:anti-sigma factor RsiW
MKQCPENIEDYMHDYLDEDINEECASVLLEHIAECDECMNIFHELNKTDAFLKSTPISAPSGFTANVMGNLPKQSKGEMITKWLQRNPVLIAASLFILLMGSTLFSYWGEDEKQFSFSKDPNLVVVGQTVIVPEGKTVKGDLVVKNGNIKVEGKVNGDVTVINGDNYLAGAGEVTGNIEEIDKLFEWIWYHMKNTVSGVF